MPPTLSITPVFVVPDNQSSHQHMVHTATVDMEFRERAKLFVERKSFLERFRHRRPQKSNSEAPMKVKTKEKSKLIHDIKLFHD